MSCSGTIDDYESLLIEGTPLLDVRAPVEFAKGAFPCAINLPLMTDDERHKVGIEYKRAGQDKAIELGAQLIPAALRAERVATWQRFASDNPRCALYCFRGGLRSRITQQWLQDAGVDLPLVKGGYKALRTFIIETLDSLCKELPFVLISGRTGIGKTLLVNAMDRSIDLEAMAVHRGSSFGRMAVAQPGNIDFENAVTIELMRLARSGSGQVFLEDESRMIGSVCIPQKLREAMLAAPVVVLEAPLHVRINHALADYVKDLLVRYTELHGPGEGFEHYAGHHRQSLGRIRKRLGGQRFSQACNMLEDALDAHRNFADVSAYEPFIELLLTDYYDPMYDYQMQNKRERIVFRGSSDEILQWVGQQQVGKS